MTKINKVPFEFINESKEGKHILTLSGNIQKKYWRDDDVINAKDIREILDSVKEDIVIKLNSPGGDVFEGIEIYNYLKNHPSNVTVEVMGQSASAATFVCAGADEVIMNVGTTFMIHEAATFAWGNKTEIKKTLQALETIDDSIVSIYAEKTGQSEDQIKSWINEARRFTADEAVKYGFADFVKKKENQHDVLTDEIRELVNQAVSASLEARVTNQEKLPQGTKKLSQEKTKSLVARLKKGE